jgi:hypothetical protein
LGNAETPVTCIMGLQMLSLGDTTAPSAQPDHPRFAHLLVLKECALFVVAGTRAGSLAPGNPSETAVEQTLMEISERFVHNHCAPAIETALQFHGTVPRALPRADEKHGLGTPGRSAHGGCALVARVSELRSPPEAGDML